LNKTIRLKNLCLCILFYKIFAAKRIRVNLVDGFILARAVNPDYDCP